MEPLNFQSLKSISENNPGKYLISSPIQSSRAHLSGFSLPMLLGCGILIFISLVIATGPAFVQFLPATIKAGSPLSQPDTVHWFGTDALGRDLFSRVVFGLQISIWISLAATVIAAFPGIILGMISGYYRGWIDQLISRLIEVFLSLPGLLLAIVLIARLGPSIQTMIIALGITGIPMIYRITRNETLSMARQPFIEASISLGQSSFLVIFRHILPNIDSTLLILISMRMGTFLLMGSGLSFIGLGVQPPQAELGALLASGKEYFQTAWWLILFPSLAIILVVLGFNLFGEGLRDRMDL